MERGIIQDRAALSTSSTINVSEPSGARLSRRIPGCELFVNYFADCDLALDVCCLFTAVSRLYHPRRRALYVPGTPRMLCDLPIQAIAEYYQLGVYTIHPGLLELPQAFFWPGDSHVAPEVEPAPGLRFGVTPPPALPDDAGEDCRRAWTAAQTAFAGMTGENDAMFQVVVEEECFPGFFSTNLIRTLILEQVPIYFGDPRIGESFDTAGIIRLEPDAIEHSRTLVQPDFFLECAPARRENRRRALEWTDPIVRLTKDILRRGA